MICERDLFHEFNPAKKQSQWPPKFFSFFSERCIVYVSIICKIVNTAAGGMAKKKVSADKTRYGYGWVL